MIITREFNFDSAHKLDWEPGKCKDLHGHTYKLQVAVKGDLNDSGIVINFKDLKDTVDKKVIEKLDHKYLNDIIKNPTAENIAIWIWNMLRHDINLHEIKLWETLTCFVTYRGK
jgi:6-pyruvoyltetrahydropterin/6-carboxytetrahydropterin synthase